jgi:hypothetical protein
MLLFWASVNVPFLGIEPFNTEFLICEAAAFAYAKFVIGPGPLPLPAP